METIRTDGVFFLKFLVLVEINDGEDNMRQRCFCVLMYS